jgi:serine/threonine protein phosphatase PrpC
MIEVHSFTEPGGHAVNEDAFEGHRHPDHPTGWLCVLADGQGGRAGGARAAQLACRIAAEAASRLPVKQLSDSLAWCDVLQQADQAVAGDQEAGFTTLVGLWIADGRVSGASVGDSAVFAILERGQVRELTTGQFKNPPIGSGEALPVGFAALLGSPFFVVAMSDGVWKYTGREMIVALAGTTGGPDLIETLKQKARLPGSGRFPDDFTVVVFAPTIDLDTP